MGDSDTGRPKPAPVDSVAAFIAPTSIHTGYISREDQLLSIEASGALQCWLGFGKRVWDLSDIPADSQEYIDSLSELTAELVSDLGDGQLLYDTYSELPPQSRQVERPDSNDLLLVQSDLQAFAWRFIDREHGHNTVSDK